MTSWTIAIKLKAKQPKATNYLTVAEAR